MAFTNNSGADVAAAINVAPATSFDIESAETYNAGLESVLNYLYVYIVRTLSDSSIVVCHLEYFPFFLASEFQTIPLKRKKKEIDAEKIPTCKIRAPRHANVSDGNERPMNK